MMGPTVRKKLISLLPRTGRAALERLVIEWLHGRAVKSYSQEGEDRILHRIFESVDAGFYVDIGAHHPKRFSNTFLFYQRGWHGINVDAMPGSMVLFRRLRPKDINIEAAVARSRKLLPYYIFDEPALNTCDEELALARSLEGRYRIVAKHSVETRTLADILDAYLPCGQEIDFLTIDVEGLDLEVLQSNDWERYRPRYVLVECLETDVFEFCGNVSHSFLEEQGYRIVAKTLRTSIYQDAEGERGK
jgi:FkbM family methyltransferase